MIISKKKFENEVWKRVDEERQRSEYNIKIWQLEDEVNNLKMRISRLEDKLTVPAPTPYIVTPTRTGTDLVDHTAVTTAEVKNG